MNKRLYIGILLSISTLFFGCGVTKPTPKVQKLLQKNSVNIREVCKKYPLKLKYESSGKEFSCDAKKITQDMVLSTKKDLEWKNNFSWDRKEWKASGLSPSNAIMWKNAAFSALEAQDYISNGFDIKSAEKWKNTYVLPSKIKAWEKAGFKPSEARQWKTSNIELSEAKTWRKAGFKPSEAKQWKDANIQFSNAKALRAIGLTSSESKKWIDNNFQVSEIKQWNKAEIKLSEAKKWKEIGFNNTRAKKWHAINVKPFEVKEWFKCGATTIKKVKKITAKGYKTPYEYCEYKNKLKRIKNTKPMKANRDYRCIGNFGTSFTISLSEYSLNISGGSLIAGWINKTLHRAGSFKKYTLFKTYDASVKVLTKYGIDRNSDTNLIYNYMDIHCREEK